MYGFPTDLDLEPLLGKLTTQLCVGQFDLQFTLGDYRFVVQGGMDLFRDGVLVASYRAVSWPDPEFYNLMNVEVSAASFRDSKTLAIAFGGGIEAHLLDTSNRYESCQILVGKGNPTVYIV